jgi:3-hydroxymyristoyl/3-hydroxydecanoyl-(acyl carrier protein) dehydratase
VINTELEKLELKITTGDPTVRLVVPDGLSYFEGHFPGFPVLPGVATIDVTLEAIRRTTQASSIRLRKIKRAKFLQPIHPGHKIEIKITPLGSERETTDWKAEWKSISGSGSKNDPENGEAVLVAELSLSLVLNR